MRRGTQVPALNIQHQTPFHFQHFTPMGLAMHMVQAGFQIVEVGQWGNLDYETQLLSQLHWPGYSVLANLARGRSGPGGVYDGGADPLIINDRRHPCQVWTLVRRPPLAG